MNLLEKYQIKAQKESHLSSNPQEDNYIWHQKSYNEFEELNLQLRAVAQLALRVSYTTRAGKIRIASDQVYAALEKVKQQQMRKLEAIHEELKDKKAPNYDANFLRAMGKLHSNVIKDLEKEVIHFRSLAGDITVAHFLGRISYPDSSHLNADSPEEWVKALENKVIFKTNFA